MKINANFRALKESYLFSTVGAKFTAYQKAHPEKRVIKLSIGDVTRPLAPVVVSAMERAAREMGDAATFRGYGPDATCYAYEPLLEAVRARYARRGIALGSHEIFISDGAKSDLSNLLDLFSAENTVLVPDPVYPVYVDTNIMAGRRILYAAAVRENGFLPLPDAKVHADIVYICSPNNPTGAAYDRAGLQAWVDYAVREDAVILYDAAYEAFIEGGLPHSIFEIEGARECAIEICSFSKTAGFTGIRCGYTVIPDSLKREGVQLCKMFARRQSTKFNGVSYITQMGAAAAFSEEGERQILENIAYYKQNAAKIGAMLDAHGIYYTGGKHSPYIWMQCPKGMTSWEFFDALLERACVVGTPGSGFGKNGEGYFRITAFATKENTAEACRRMGDFLDSL